MLDGKKTRRWGWLAMLVLMAGGPANVVAEAQPPNVLLVLLDDSGWTDFGCYGSRIETPEIDRIAAGGMRFTDCHSAAPNCSPSRAALLTGRIPARAGIYSYRPAGHVMHLRDEEVTLAELLKAKGYRTGHFGKWHLSGLESEQPGPLDQGFEYSLGTTNNAQPSHLNPVNFVRNGEAVGKVEGYACQIVVDEAMRWLDQIGGDDGGPAPFFACVWFQEPHTPIASPPDLVAKYRERHPELSKKAATYYANIENVDRAMGRLRAHLERTGAWENTLVFITSDNGPLAGFSCEGLRGRKSNLWEGGHRVPGIFHWPGQIKAGTECDVPVSGIDFLPTVCEVADIEPPSDRTIDGVSLLPLLEGREEAFRREHPLYWFFYRLNPAVAVRDGDWVLIAETNDAQRPKAHPLTIEDMPRIKASKLTNAQLFNLARDLAQTRDVAEAYPEVLTELTARAAALHREVVAGGHAWDVPESSGQGKSRRVWDSYGESGVRSEE